VENSLWGAIKHTVAAYFAELRGGSEKSLTCELQKLKEHYAGVQYSRTAEIITHSTS
jgi:hypothetical protein